MKWLWIFPKEKRKPWCSYLAAKYLSNGKNGLTNPPLKYPASRKVLFDRARLSGRTWARLWLGNGKTWPATYLEKARRGLQTATHCPICHQEGEDTVHALRDCAWARFVWTHLVDPSDWAAFISTPLVKWLDVNLKSQKAKGSLSVEWAVLFAVAVHQIWAWGNKMRHDPLYTLPIEPWVLILNRAQEIAHCLENEVEGTRYEMQYIGWKAPPPPFIKINVDGCAKVNPGKRTDEIWGKPVQPRPRKKKEGIA